MKNYENSIYGLEIWISGQKYLLYKCEDISLNPLNPHKTRHTVQTSVIKERRELETGKSPESLGQVC